MRFDGKNNKQRASIFKLTELSGVTTPAHTGADVTIFKVGDTDPKVSLALRRKKWREENPAKDDSEMPEELQKFSGLFKSEFDEALAAQNVRLQMQPVWDTIWVNECALRQAIEEAVKDGQPVKPIIAQYVTSLAQSLLTNEDPAMSAELQKQLDEANAQIGVLTAEAGMNDAQKAYYGTLDETAKASFRALDTTTRDIMVSTAKSADEVVKVNGTEIRKSAVGSAAFDVLKAQQATIDKQNEDTAVAKFETLAKSAEFESLPGEVVAKGIALRAIDGLPDVAKAAVTSMLKAGAEAMKARHAPAAVKVSLDDGMNASDKLETMAKAKAKADGTDFVKAYSEVLATEEGQALYNMTVNGE